MRNLQFRIIILSLLPALTASAGRFSELEHYKLYGKIQAKGLKIELRNCKFRRAMNRSYGTKSFRSAIGLPVNCSAGAGYGMIPFKH